MAPPAHSHTQPSKEKEENEPYSEDEDEEEESSEEEPERKEESSGEEEEEDGGSSEEGEGDGEKEPKTQTLPPKSLPRNEDEDEDGSDSEPDSDSSPSQFKLQPISKEPATSTKRARQGDCSNEDSSRSEKKLKTVEKKSAPTSVSATSGGVGFITRLWTEEDEIALLQGMINFKSQKGVDPYADMGAFFDYIKQKLQVVFSRAQMSSKISRMKKRFLNALEKGENGEDPVFSKPHECKAFDLSKKIWGAAVEKSKGSNTNRVVENVKKDKGKSEISSEDDKQLIVRKVKEVGGGFWSNYPFFRRSFEVNGICQSLSMSYGVMSFVKEKMSLLGSGKAKDLEEKWKDLFEKETELYLEMLNLMREQTKLALEM
ncbi:STOREKEEPER -like [Olea europaea subsp. europaea]|uniref:STOREKEEPER -like n=1 Tax=Olea europaea subsp. europaea TaxID=158383 RepID=A0A8S0SPV8_OLEEU|nr:STOREKEEPER -like [Olea europaea subsp. europaea]